LNRRLLAAPEFKFTPKENPWADPCFMKDGFEEFFSARFWDDFMGDDSVNVHRQIKSFLKRHPYIPLGVFMASAREETSFSGPKVRDLSADIMAMLDRMTAFCRALRQCEPYQLPDTWRTWSTNGARRVFNGLNFLLCHRLGARYEMHHEYAGVSLDKVLENKEAMQALGSMPVWIFHGSNERSVAYVEMMFSEMAARIFEQARVQSGPYFCVMLPGETGSVQAETEVFGEMQIAGEQVLVTRSERDRALENERTRVEQAQNIADGIDLVIMLHLIGFAIISVLLTGAMSYGLTDLPLTGNYEPDGSLNVSEFVSLGIGAGVVLDDQTSDLRTIGIFFLSLLTFRLLGRALGSDQEARVVITGNPAEVQGELLNLDGPEAPQTSVGQIRRLYGGEDSGHGEEAAHSNVKVGAITSSITNQGRLDYRGQNRLFSNLLTMATTRPDNVPDFIWHRSPRKIPVSDALYVGDNFIRESHARRLIRAFVVANTTVPISDEALRSLPIYLYEEGQKAFDVGDRLWRLVSHIQELSWFSVHELNRPNYVLGNEDMRFIGRNLHLSTDQLYRGLFRQELISQSLLLDQLFSPSIFEITTRDFCPREFVKDVVCNEVQISDHDWRDAKSKALAIKGDDFHETAGRHGPKIAMRRLIDEYATHYKSFVASLDGQADADGFIDLSKVDHPGFVSGFVFTGDDVAQVTASGGDRDAAKAFGSGKTRSSRQANAYFQRLVKDETRYISVVKHVNGKYVYGLMSPQSLEAFIERANLLKENKAVKIGAYILVGAGAASLLVINSYVEIPKACGDNDFCNVLTTDLVKEMFDFKGYLPGVIFQKLVLNPLNFATVVLGFGIYHKIRHHLGGDIPKVNYHELDSHCDTVSGQLELEDRAALEFIMAFNVQPTMFLDENLEALMEKSEASLASLLTQALKTGRVRNMPVCMFIGASSNYLNSLPHELVSDVREPGYLLLCKFSEYTELFTEEDCLSFLQTLLRMEDELRIDLSPAQILSYIREHQRGNLVRLNRDTLFEFATQTRVNLLAQHPEFDPFAQVTSRDTRFRTTSNPPSDEVRLHVPQE